MKTETKKIEISETKKIEISADKLNILNAMNKASEKIETKNSENFEYASYKKEIVKNINFLNVTYKLGLSDTEIEYLKNHLSDFLTTKTKYGEKTILKIYKNIRKGFQNYFAVQIIENPKIIRQIKEIMQEHIAGKNIS